MATAESPATRAGPLARVPSPVLVIGGIASVQFGSATATKLFSSVGPGGAVLLRLLTASIVLCAVTRPTLAGRSRHQLALAALFGLVLAAMNMTFYHALQRIPLGIAVTLEFVGPLGVAVLGSRRRLDLAWAALAIAGILALTHGNAHGLNPLGVILALVAGGCWGAYILVNARLGQAFADGSGLALAMCVATIVSLPIGIAEGGTQLLSWRSLALGAAVGILSSAIPYSLELEALRRIATHVFGVLMSLEPAVAALAGLIVLSQGLSVREIGGMALVVAASVGASLAARRRSTTAPAVTA
ncbi:MAG: EamA family transporter [Solirubrobacteraceae bacterium]